MIRISGELPTLNDIEHRILGPVWGESRTQYADNSAARSRPNLAQQAYWTSDLETMLDLAARAYMNYPLAFRIVEN